MRIEDLGARQWSEPVTVVPCGAIYRARVRATRVESKDVTHDQEPEARGRPRPMIGLLKENSLLLLFAVAAMGYVLGQLRLKGFSLGVAAVLFVGLGAGAIDPDLRLPEIVQSLGLVLFVYGIGLSSGPAFFASFRRRGLRDNGLALGVVAVAAAACAGEAMVLRVPGASAAGLYAGALTNTPALASVMELLKARQSDVAADPVVAYSLSYPGGVLGVILAIWIARRVFRNTAPAGAPDGPDAGAIENVTVRIERPGLTRDRALSLFREHGLAVIFGRLRRAGRLRIMVDDIPFEAGDLVTLVGREGDLTRASELVGTVSDERIDLDRHVLDFRRMFVSRAEVAEKPLSELQLPRRFGAIVTRIRRGDVDLLPTADVELELSDRVRVVAPRERMADIARFFGDSYKALSEIDVITFSMGIALGLLLGSVPIPVPGGGSFALGLAGGPLVSGLCLGRIGRTGPLVWTLPYSANLTLRQLGLVLFLAGVGTRSGHAFATTLRSGAGGGIVLAGAVVTCLSALATVSIGRAWLRIAPDVLLGIVSGIHTQPAALAFATAQTKNDLPNVGYASVYPVATIAKIALAQALVLLLR